MDKKIIGGIALILCNILAFIIVLDLILFTKVELIKVIESLILIIIFGLNIVVFMLSVTRKPIVDKCEYCNKTTSPITLYTNATLYPHGCICIECLDKAEDAEADEN